MSREFLTIDYVILALYAVMIITAGYFIGRGKKGVQKTTKDYFLASKSLKWWAIGASCIAANISAEQIIGMTGSGFAIGLAIASYEFASAVILIFVGKYFLPIFIKKDIYTLPEFLEQRYDKRVKSSLAIFWLFLYVFVNLTSILYMGALAINITLDVPFVYGVIILGLVAVMYSLYGGLASVAWTDIIQVVLLLGGGVLTTYLALNILSDGEGIIAGLHEISRSAPEKMHMILDKSNDYYNEIPGMFGIIFGIIFVANTFYWGFNQYTIQRALAGKSLREAQHGVMFAGYLKLIMPILVVVPGMAAFVMLNDPEIMSRLGHLNPQYLPTLEQTDKAYPWLLGFLPAGLKGLAFAALCAAIVSSLASMINSTSTIFTMDIYKVFINKNASEKQMVTTGRITAVLALLIASIIAPLLTSLDQAFQYIQEFTGFVSPGIVTIFLLGLFWKRTTANAALWVAALTIPLDLVFYIFFPEIPFLNRMAYVCFITLGIAIAISLATTKGPHPKAIRFEKGLFKTSPVFNVAAIGILLTLAVFYIVFW